MSVLIETTVGDLVFDLYLKERPRASMNFLKLCKMKYYNFSLFHSVQRNFMAQTGDPEGTGRGGCSVFQAMYGDQAKFFEAETNPKLKHTKIGTLSMVNNGNDMHGSQFFFTLGEDLDYLDGVHTVFGELAEGLDTLVKINDAICDDEFRPYKDIRISHTIVLHDPFEEPKELVYPQSPEPTREQLSSGRIDADEEVDENQGKSMEQIEEELKDKEARARATILEMIGDIPDADIRPPENVLFVCKLNPVTTDEDLEIIFGRFGNVLSCEIIRDHKTGDSLQYGFIEFDNPKSCEDAYFKMNNVLIDDRRIHVDFSQSVSKIRWKGKGKGVVYENEKARQELSRGRDFTDKKQDPGSSRRTSKIIDTLKSSLNDVKDKEMHRNSHGSRRRDDYHSRERGRREDRQHEERGRSRYFPSHLDDRYRDRHGARDKVRASDSHRSRDRSNHAEGYRRDSANSSRYKERNGSVRDTSGKSRSTKNNERPFSQRDNRLVKSKSDSRHVRTEHKKKRQPSSSDSSTSDSESDSSSDEREKPKSFSRKKEKRRCRREGSSSS